jgi:hypothetical protein
MSNTKAKQEDLNADFDLAPEQLEPLKRAMAKQKAITTPRLKLTENTISVDHSDKRIGQLLLMEALGTGYPDFAKGIVRQLVNASGSLSGPTDEDNLNFMLSIIAGINPNDPIETMIGAQMAATHNAAMAAAATLARSTVPLEREFAERRLNKLSRTFVALVAALDDHRRRSEPPVSVNNVSVSHGAVVGSVTQSHSVADPVGGILPAKRKRKS